MKAQTATTKNVYNQDAQIVFGNAYRMHVPEDVTEQRPFLSQMFMIVP